MSNLTIVPERTATLFTDDEEVCAICGGENGSDTVFHWRSPHSSVLAAVTCSDACADTYENDHRTPAKETK